MGIKVIVVDLVVHAHALLSRSNRIIGGATHALLIQLAAVLTAKALKLIHRRTALQQFHGNVGLGGTSLTFLHSYLDNLRIAHTLSECCQRQANGQKHR